MDKLKFRRFDSFTIVETIVSLIIIIIVFGIAATIFVQTSLDSASFKKIKASGVLYSFITETNENKSFSDEEVQIEDYYIKRQILEYGGSKEIVRIRFSIYDRNNQLIVRQQNLFNIR